MYLKNFSTSFLNLNIFNYNFFYNIYIIYYRMDMVSKLKEYQLLELQDDFKKNLMLKKIIIYVM